MSRSRRRLGREGEERAAAHLERRGYRILERNVRAGGVEIDLVAARGRLVVFVEVKARSGSGFGGPLHAVDVSSRGRFVAYVLMPEEGGHRLAIAEADAAAEGTDLTRAVRELPPGTPIRPAAGASRLLTRDDLDAWTALGLALTSADLVGAMRGVIQASVAYARERVQYGVAIGSFQAVQHLLAEAHVLAEGARSAAAYPAWAVDVLEPEEARAAGRVAKACCARAARTVCETAVQVHGGIGNTWDCTVHVYLRRALLSCQWFGGDGEMLRQIERTRLGASHGLP